jgi:ABC-type multidrug transport system ATPase subunit
VVLTTHSAREAAAVCTRVAVMASGRLLALGTPDELQRRYGAGHTLRAEPLPGAAAALVEHVRSRAPAGAHVTCDADGTLRVTLPPPCAAPLSALAAALCGAPVVRWEMATQSLAVAVAAVEERAHAADPPAEMATV